MSYQSGFSTGFNIRSDIKLPRAHAREQDWARPMAVPMDKPIESVQRNELTGHPPQVKY